MTRDRRLASIITASVISLGCVGCGGDEDSTTAAATDTSSSTTTQTTVTAEGTGDSTEYLGATLTASTAGKPGVVVTAVAPDSRSRLKVGDVVIAVDGEPVATPDELIDAVGEPELGDEVQLRIIRGSKRITLAEVQVPTAFLGTEVKDAPHGRGAAVVKVVPDSPAAKGRIEAGDVVVAVDGEPVRSGDDLVAAVAAHVPGDEVTLAVERGSEELELSVTLVRNPGIAR